MIKRKIKIEDCCDCACLLLRIDKGRGQTILRAHFEFAERRVPLERK